MLIRILTLAVFMALTAALGAGCPQRGAALGDEDAAVSGVDCGEHGSADGEHCHCNMGYLFDGELCVTPIDITEICDEHADHEMACVCPSEGECHCSGEVVTLAGARYCVPELHG